MAVWHYSVEDLKSNLIVVKTWNLIFRFFLHYWD